MHRIGTRDEWQAARDELLEREKELTRRNDELARQRRELPWVPVEQLHGELALELGDRLRERWLREVQLRRGAGDLSLFSDDNEVAQLTQPKRHLPRSLAASVVRARRAAGPRPRPPELCPLVPSLH